MLANDVPEIVDVRHRQEEIDYVLGDDERLHSFLYVGLNIWGQLMIRNSDSGRVEYTQSLGGLNRPLPRCVVRNSLPVFEKVEKLLVEKCELAPTDRGFTQRVDDSYADNLPPQIPSGCGAITSLSNGFYQRKIEDRSYLVGYVGAPETTIPKTLELLQYRSSILCSGSIDALVIDFVGSREISEEEEPTACNWRGFEDPIESLESMAANLSITAAAHLVCTIGAVGVASLSTPQPMNSVAVIEGQLSCK
ncbi:MAG: hypothetical protein AAF387_18290 [Pseudomonadota bacterium]